MTGLYGVLAVICRRCGARIGSPCRTRSGHPTRRHNSRATAFYDAVYETAGTQMNRLDHHLALTPDNERWAKFIVPKDDTQAEVARITAFLRTVAIDDPTPRACSCGCGSPVGDA